MAHAMDHEYILSSVEDATAAGQGHEVRVVVSQGAADRHARRVLRRGWPFKTVE